MPHGNEWIVYMSSDGSGTGASNFAPEKRRGNGNSDPVYNSTGHSDRDPGHRRGQGDNTPTIWIRSFADDFEHLIDALDATPPAMLEQYFYEGDYTRIAQAAYKLYDFPLPPSLGTDAEAGAAIQALADLL